MARSIVFVHGVRTSSAIWDHQVATMRRAGHECRTVDLPGHGRRARERFTMAGALRAIDDAVASCASPPLLVGMSLGGYSALAYAARHQDSVAGLLLAGCSTEIRGKPVEAYRQLSRYVIRALRRDAANWHVVTDMLSAVRGHSSLADLRSLSVPVWLVNGSRDVLRLEERRYLAARPGTRLTVIPRAGHDVNLHAPAAFNRVLHGVLGELPGVPAGSAGAAAVSVAAVAVADGPLTNDLTPPRDAAVVDAP